jgi:hypothetical protein
MTKKVSQRLSSRDYEKLGRLLVSVAEVGYRDKKQLYKVSFIRGILTGLGTVIGATIVVGLLLYLLSALETIPFIGDVADSVKESLSSPDQ